MAPPEREARGRRPAPSALRVGSVVVGSTYEIVAHLGSGVLGEVFKAKHRRLESLHAIKAIRPDLAHSLRIVRMLDDEARALSRLRHDAIVRYDGLIEENDRLLLFMEFVNGPTLAELMLGKPLAPEAATGLLVRLAGGLAVAHAASITHRDIAPTNILVPRSDPRRAVLIDFGLAGVGRAAARTEQPAAGYTPSYASPEQRAGEAVGPPSDVYGLAMVIVAALLGDAPRAGMCGRIRVPWRAGRRLRILLRRMLHPDPQRRPLARELAPALRPLSDQQAFLRLAPLGIALLALLVGALWLAKIGEQPGLVPNWLVPIADAVRGLLDRVPQ